MGDVLDREEVRERLRRFLEAAIEKAGGPKAMAYELQQLGFTGRGDRYEENTVRSWRRGSVPPGDVLFGIAARWKLSLDEFVFGERRLDELALLLERMERMEKNQRTLIRWASEQPGYNDVLSELMTESQQAAVG